MISRRSFIAQCATGLVAGCATPGQTPMQNLATLVNDVMLAFNGLSGELPQIEQMYPNLIPANQEATVTADIRAGLTLMQKIQANLTDPQLGGWLQQAEQDLNAVLMVLSAIPIPPPYNLVVMAATVVAPELEDYLNKQFGTQIRRSVTLRQRMAPHMTIVQARSILRTASAKRIRR